MAYSKKQKAQTVANGFTPGNKESKLLEVFGALWKTEKVTAIKIGRDTRTDPSTVRKWLHKLESVGIARIAGIEQAPTGSSPYLWELIPPKGFIRETL